MDSSRTVARPTPEVRVLKQLRELSSKARSRRTVNRLRLEAMWTRELVTLLSSNRVRLLQLLSKPLKDRLLRLRLLQLRLRPPRLRLLKDRPLLRDRLLRLLRARLPKPRLPRDRLPRLPKSRPALLLLKRSKFGILVLKHHLLVTKWRDRICVYSHSFGIVKARQQKAEKEMLE
jgi:hypothetical protein